jgi:hypothetical protein
LKIQGEQIITISAVEVDLIATGDLQVSFSDLDFEANFPLECPLGCFPAGDRCGVLLGDVTANFCNVVQVKCPVRLVKPQGLYLKHPLPICNLYYNESFFSTALHNF